MPTLINELQSVECIEGADRPRVDARFVGYKRAPSVWKMEHHFTDRRP